MRLIDEIIDDYRIKKYGNLAHILKTSHKMLVGGRGDDNIKIEKFLIASQGDFSNYQELIKNKLSEDYKLEFLDYSLLMGKFFEVYNLYCFIFINKEIRKKIINSNLITKENTINILKLNIANIYQHMLQKFRIDFESFKAFLSSLFIVKDNFSMYNNQMFNELSYILIGNYLFLEEYGLGNGFIGSEESIDFFNKMNKISENNKKR